MCRRVWVLVAVLRGFRQYFCVGAAALFIGLAVGFALVVWAAIVVAFGRLPRWVRVGYFSFFVADVIAAYFSTYRYIYYTNPNTRFHGWPIPWVIFQRDSATEPWLDFVGPTIILALPINFILFALLPSLAVIILSRRIS